MAVKIVGRDFPAHHCQCHHQIAVCGQVLSCSRMIFCDSFLGLFDHLWVSEFSVASICP
jgi:hypothetical protein